MPDSMKFKLSNPEPIAIRELEQHGRPPQLETEMEIEDIPATSEDIARLIHEGMTEITLNGTDLSNEALFIQRLDADIKKYCELRRISPAPTMEQFADMIMERDPEKKVKADLALTPDNFKAFYDFLTERYAIEKDSAHFVQDPTGPRRHAKTVRIAENRALIDVEKSMRGFWTRVYLAIVKKAEAELLPERLRTRLEKVINEMDSEVRAQRLESLANQIARLAAGRIPTFGNALYEAIFGRGVKGRVFSGDERTALYTRLANAAEAIRPATEAGTYTAKKIEEYFLSLSRLGNFDRSKSGGVRLARRRVERILTAFNSVIEEPFELLRWKEEEYSGERIAKKLASFLPFQQNLFLAALQERLEDVKPDMRLHQMLHKLIADFPGARNDAASLRTWGNECAEFLNDVMTAPERPEAPVVEVAAAAEEGQTGPVVVESQAPLTEGDARPARVELNSPERILAYLREGGKRVNVAPAVRAAQQLNPDNARFLFRLLAPVILDDGKINDSDLRIGAGQSYKEGEINQIREFIRSGGTSNGRKGWEAFFLLARRTRKFRTFGQ